MFFSDDLLTGKKGSLGIIWLMATLGPRSRRVSRKSITTLEISRTCEIIATPPEPMALRLSGTLLVGVARVYYQTCNIFYDDCHHFDMALRRSMVVSAPGRRRFGRGLDLRGDGTSRSEHITFPEVDVPDLVHMMDMDFAGIDWHNPLGEKRRRRATSKLESLQAKEDVSEDESGSDSDGDESPERKRQRLYTPLNLKRNTFSVEPRICTRDNSPLNGAPEEFSVSDFQLDILPFDEDPGSVSNRPFEDVPDVPMQDTQDMLDNYHPMDDILAPEKRDSSMLVEDLVDEPPKKKARSKKVKRVTFDDDIENETLGNTQQAYQAAMEQQRKEMRARKLDSLAQARADTLVDGWGVWLQFTDDTMSEFFMGVAKAPVFKWKLDVDAHKTGKGAEPPAPAPAAVAVQEEPVWQQDHQMLQNRDELMMEPDFQIDEVGRDRNRFETPQPLPSQPFPWASSSAWSGGMAGPPSSLSTPIPNVMTPQELKLRSVRDSRLGRSRSGSIMSIRPEDMDDLALVPDAEWADGELPLVPGPFIPTRLASIETQCQQFLIFVEQRMELESTDELTFDEIVPLDATRRTAAAAFHNCLELATKRLLRLEQDEFHGPITLRLAEV